MFKTALLLAAMTALFMFIGAAAGGQTGMFMALMFALVTNVATYWFSGRMVLAMYRARPMDEQRYGWLVQATRTMARRANMPMPTLYVIENPQPNAFATGRNPANGVVAVTTGLMDRLSEREVIAVVGHELGHIKNYDTLIMTVTATIAGAISMLANFMMFFGGSRGENRPNPLVMILISILAPLAAMLVQMAISRTREYGADAAGAEFSGDPAALAGALAKISGMAQAIDNDTAENNPATAHMFIINPLHARAVDGLFSTHPKTENRIAALQEIAAAKGQHVADALTTESTMPVSRKVKRGSFSFRKNKSPWK